MDRLRTIVLRNLRLSPEADAVRAAILRFDTLEAAVAWLNTPNRLLSGATPVAALLAGRPDRVRAALEALDSGVFV